MDGFIPHSTRRDYTDSYKSPSLSEQSENREYLNDKPPDKSSDKLLVSIRFNLPRYGRWRITKFAKRYPYLALAMAIGGIIILALLVTLISAL